MGVGDAVRRRAAFLDRDGVINRAFVRDRKPFPPADISQLEVLPGVPEALGRLKAAGFLSIVVTNQPDVARGTMARPAVEAINERLRGTLALVALYTCWHDDMDRCACRKPLPGLLLEAAREHDIDLARSFMVGDRWRDIAAGRAAGCRTAWISCGYDEPAPSPPADFTGSSLAEAVNWILQTKGKQ